MEVIALKTTEPRYFITQEAAFKHHYSQGGYLWKRKKGIRKSYKPYASGLIQVSRLEHYDLYMVDGREPTEGNIQEAKKACYDARDLENAMV